MARAIRVSTFGVDAPLLGPDALAQPSEHVARFWQEQLAKVLPDQPDLIVLPELCGRHCNLALRDQLDTIHECDDAVGAVLRDIARRHACYVVHPTLRLLEDGTRRNTAVLYDRTGSVAGGYDKCHPVIEEITEYGIVAGECAHTIECDFGTVGFLICFDLNFEQLRNSYRSLRPDLLVFPSMFHGGIRQAWWAVSTQAHFVSACAGLPSGVISPIGHAIATTTGYTEHVTADVNLDCAVVHLDYNQDRLARLKLRYGRLVTITDPGLLGSVLVTSESDAAPVDTLLSEMGIERLDDYLARSLAVQTDSRENGRR